MKKPNDFDNMDSYVCYMLVFNLSARQQYTALSIMKMMNEYQDDYINSKTLKR